MCGPRKAILQQDLESDSALQQALTFIAVTFGIAFIAQIPILPAGQSTEKTFAIVAVVSALGFGLNVFLVILSWRIVGGKLTFKKVLIVTCYFSGVSTILFMTVSLIAMGAFKFIDPLLYQQMMSGSLDDPSGAFNSLGYKVFLVLSGVAMIAVYGWILWIWDAYRQLMQVDKRRSGIAFLLFTALSPLLILVQLLMYDTTLPPRTSPPLPDELMGEWQSTGPTDAIGVAGNGNVRIHLFAPQLRMIPNGEYKKDEFERHSANNPNCSVAVLRTELGWATVHGSLLVLSPFYGGETTADDCSGTRSHSSTKPAKAEYQYQIIQGPSGWQLHLSNRMGGVNFAPKNP